MTPSHLYIKCMSVCARMLENVYVAKKKKRLASSRNEITIKAGDSATSSCDNTSPIKFVFSLHPQCVHRVNQRSPCRGS